MSWIPLDDCWFLSGPTASGKSAVGIALARSLDAEIVSMDSMALYRGMDLGTAKPTPDERAAVPHHLIDVVEPHQEYSLAEYVAAAHRAAASIRQRGRRVLFVGGTPLYLKALLRGIFEGPAADPELRRRLEDEERRFGPGHLHRRLAAVDPAAAARLHPNDTRRLVRALEVYEKTGRPISEYQVQFNAPRPAPPRHVFVLDWPRDELVLRIDRRVDAMFAAGLVDEVRRLAAGPLPLSRTARQALGYREVLEHLAGVRGLAETIDRVKIHTRQFAKRQSTWFRSLSECRFVPLRGELDPVRVAQRLCADA
ncbi:MAG: tRNA (adenosine(37)-N6)-dimethylallyltransferase MiaA [Thermoguttaceae bacterium]|jgi:tRNA dimethylallyltransferase|nr:tRNA (adenosine(37)-N6)-dimethylallyltransferase MiaA [Thermoguttaceae bacterium]